MQVTVAKTAGFCFGVRRALELTQKSAALSPTCTLGELIHNRQVVEELEALISAQGLDALCESRSSVAFLARPRRQEIFACFNRYRGLKI